MIRYFPILFTLQYELDSLLHAVGGNYTPICTKSTHINIPNQFFDVTEVFRPSKKGEEIKNIEWNLKF